MRLTITPCRLRMIAVREPIGEFTSAALIRVDRILGGTKRRRILFIAQSTIGGEKTTWHNRTLFRATADAKLTVGRFRFVSGSHRQSNGHRVGRHAVVPRLHAIFGLRRQSILARRSRIRQGFPPAERTCHFGWPGNSRSNHRTLRQSRDQSPVSIDHSRKPSRDSRNESSRRDSTFPER